jgi:hypothetical protein
VTKLPWNEGDLNLETMPLVQKLAQLNKRGILTINSQVWCDLLKRKFVATYFFGLSVMSYNLYPD